MARQILFGWSQWDMRRRVALSDPTQNSVLTIGLPGVGKSACVAIPNLVRCENSMVVCDFNGELAQASSLWRSAGLGQDVWIFDPMRASDPDYLPKDEHGNVRYLKVNPIDFIIKARNPMTVAFSIAEAFIPEGGLKENHWALGGQSYKAAFMVFVAFDPWLDEVQIPRNMEGLWMILSTAELEQEALLRMAAGDNPFLADTANTYLNKSKDNRELEGIRNQVRVACAKVYSEPGILESMSETNIDFADLRRMAMTIYLCMKGNLVSTHNKVLRVAFKLLLDTIEDDGRILYDAHDRPMVVVQCDEFPVLGNFRPLVDGIARYRGFGLKFHLFCQTLGQLASREAYGDNWQTIMGNVGTVQFFGGTSDWLTAETISRLTGVGTEPGLVVSGNREVNSPHGFSQNLYGRPLYMPDEIMRLELPKQLLLRAGHAPVEAYLFGRGHSDLSDYRLFMHGLREGHSVDLAARTAHGYAEHLRKAQQRAEQPSPQPERKPPVAESRTGLIKRLFRKG